MTLTSLLNDQESTLDLLTAMIERNKLYVSTFGYPSGTACPHCGKQNFSPIRTLEQLAAAPPGTQMAHEYCVEIADLKAKLAKLQADPPTIHMVQLPNAKQEGQDSPEAAPAPTPVPEPVPNQSQEVPNQSQETPQEESRASA